MARLWQSQGAQALHLVDLDGAKAGRPVSLDALRSIAKTVTIPCQLGGGLRTEADIMTILDLGINRVILGSQACKDPSWLAVMACKYPEKILLGLDAKDGLVAAEGWLEVTKVPALTLAKHVSHLPLAGMIYTDIARDGMLAGPDWDGLAAMASTSSLPVIASGGVTTINDVRRLANMRLAGCIIGRALYEQTLDLSAALRVAAEPSGVPAPPGDARRPSL